MRRVFLVAAILLLVLGCEQPQKKEEILARVGNSVLTAAQARASIDTTNASYASQIRNYVDSWVTTEILYQEALKHGIEQKPEFQQQLTDVRKQLAVQQFLNESVYADTGGVSEDSLHAFFDQHAAEFFVREDMMKLNCIGFGTREQANAFAAKITRGASWELEYAALVNNPSTAGEIVFVSTGKYYTQQTLLFPELWKVAQTLRENDISFPVRTPSGYYIVQLLSSVRSGSGATFEIARDEARMRLLRNREQQRYDSLIGTLRQHSSVELLMPPVQQNDTTQQLQHD